MSKKVFTFGCRLNSFESEIIKKNLEVSDCNNVAVFNTCAVTKEAQRQARQAIRKFQREHPDSKIIVTGCGAQINPDEFLKITGVDKVIGNEEKLVVDSYFFNDDAKQEVLVNDIMSVTQTAPAMIQSLDERARAFMQVQTGCNHRCTFCIIPYGRGNSRSVPLGEVVKQAQILVQSGYNEIVLTGVDISGYGADLPAQPNLSYMIRSILEHVPNLRRLRLSSVDVAEVDDDLVEIITNEPRFMPYLHLSLQAGDDMILKRMKRRHTRSQALDFCKKIRQLRPDIAFGADIIAGFPTETDEMFENTLSMVKEAGIVYLHVFPYSEREGTPAARIPNEKQVPVTVRKRRAALLRAEGDRLLQEFLKQQVGKTHSVVIENNMRGRTENFAPVELNAEYEIGSVQEVSIGAAGDKMLVEM